MNGSASSHRATLAIDFIIVGAGIAGLVAAAALMRVGHRVTVLEKRPCLEDHHTSAGFRLPPNLSKIFFHWGLEEKLRQIAVTSESITMLLYESGDMLGAHVWDEEMLRESRGEFMFTHHYDFQRLLHDTAVSYGAKIRFKSSVVSVDPDAHTVTLASGEVISGDVIIGADGMFGECRKLLLEDGQQDQPGNLVLYNTIVSKKAMMRDPDLAYFFNQKHVNMYGWFGNERCVLAFPTGGSEDFAFHLYSSSDGADGTWEDTTSCENLIEAMSTSEPRLRKLAKLAAPPACVPVIEPAELEDWVHENGRMLVIGEAAHPLPVGGIQIVAMAVEDGAVLAKLFSHLRSEDQIESFLYAFQDLRQSRCNNIRAEEVGNLFYMTMPPSEHTEIRDNEMQAKHRAGKNVLDPWDDADVDLSGRWEGIKQVFGYDAEDEADNWWVEWGLLRERAKGVETPATKWNIQVDFAVAS